MWNNNPNSPPIPFRPGSNFGNGGGMMPPPGGFGQSGNQSSISNFGMMIHGVSQNMQNQYIAHICKLEPLIIKEMKESKFKGSITNMAKLRPPKRELCLVIDTFIMVSNKKCEVRM